MRTIALAAGLLLSVPLAPAATDRVMTKSGPIEGTGPGADGVRMFKGIPYAAPPVGRLRWQPPQPVTPWKEVKQTTTFGAQCMQRRMFGDMVFRASGNSEDCLYLNVWTPAKSARDRLPVLLYFYGGGYVAGDGSEPRYDGAAMARRGIVALTVNYRLGIFGFFAHPELTKESPHHASGNYGLLDQAAALQWVHDNIAAFGGDPQKVTIGGESAGSISVSAQMASPLSKNLIAGAIGESGAAIKPTLPPVPLAEGEAIGEKFAASINAASLDALRAMSGDQLLDAASKQGAPRFPLTVDGYFLTKTVADTFAAGEQARIPLLAGWNSQENPAQALLRQAEPTPENFEKAIRADPVLGAHADELVKLYSGKTPDEILQAATDLASDRFIAFSTWKWTDLHGRTGGKPVYRYYYARPRPAMKPEKGNQPAAHGAAHSAEIEYALGNLATNEVYAWTPEDYKLSELMQGYFADFIKKGDPNGPGLPQWPAANMGDKVQFMRLDVDSHVETDTHQDRHALLEQIYR